MAEIAFHLNGTPVRIADQPPTRTLLDWLREHRGLTGTKECCGTGDCGACSVTVDGVLVCSCLVLGAEAQGKQIGTVEGIANGSELHPLQRKFIEHAALQCGFCTPGMMMSALGVIEQHPDASDDEIREALEGNLCRCTGYQNIVAAVRSAADEMARS